MHTAKPASYMECAPCIVVAEQPRWRPVLHDPCKLPYLWSGQSAPPTLVSVCRLDGPGGADFGPPLAAAAAAFPSVCSAPVPGAGAPRRGALPPDGMGTAKPSCESITEHFDLPFMADMLTGEGFEHICAAATAAIAAPPALPLSPMGSGGLPQMGSAKLPPRLPRSNPSEPGSSPRHSSLDGSPGPSTNPSPNPSTRLGGGGGGGAGSEPEPMQEEALQTLSLFDGKAGALAERPHAPPPPPTYRGEAVRCAAAPCGH